MCCMRLENVAVYYTVYKVRTFLNVRKQKRRFGVRGTPERDREDAEGCTARTISETHEYRL